MPEGREHMLWLTLNPHNETSRHSITAWQEYTSWQTFCCVCSDYLELRRTKTDESVLRGQIKQNLYSRSTRNVMRATSCGLKIRYSDLLYAFYFREGVVIISLSQLSCNNEITSHTYAMASPSTESSSNMCSHCMSSSCNYVTPFTRLANLSHTFHLSNAESQF